jgi:hypothetical protein
VHGAYVSTWVWVDRLGPPIELESRAKKPTVDFSAELEALRTQGLTLELCIQYFGQQQQDSTFIQRARRSYQHERGVVTFDADPMVSESVDGAYVSAWLWVWNRDAEIEGCTNTYATPPRRCCRREGNSDFCYTGLCSFYK